MNVMIQLIYVLTMQLVSTQLVLMSASALKDIEEMDLIVQVIFLNLIHVDLHHTIQYNMDIQ